MTRWRWQDARLQDKDDRMKMTGCRLASGQQCPLSVIGCQVQIRNGNNKCDWDWKLKLTVVLYLFFYISNQQKEVGIGSLLVSSNLFESQRKAFLFKDFPFLLLNDDWNVRITNSTLRGSYRISMGKKTYLRGKIQSWLPKVCWNSTPDPFLTPTLWNQFGEEGDYDVTSETLWHTFTLIWSFARTPLKIQIGHYS